MIGRGGMMGRGGHAHSDDEDWGRGGRGRGRRGSALFGRESRGGRGPRGEPIEDEWTAEPELPSLPEEYLQTVDRENITRKIEIDGSKREVRTYGQTAIIFMNWDDPRILSFGEGQVNIVFDGGVFRLTMRIGEDYREFTFEGKTHHIRLGPPSQELVLDDVGYHCLIGGDPITVHFDGAPHTIALEGKPPNVNISPVRNTDYVSGFIKLVIQATKFVTLYLDGRPQRFSIDGRAFVIKFVDSLKAVTINNVRKEVSFGGLPLKIPVRGYVRYLSFSDLPQGIIPGQIAIRDMEGERPPMMRVAENLLGVPPVRPPKEMSPPLQPLIVAGPMLGGPQPPGPLLPVSGSPQTSVLPRPSLAGPPQPAHLGPPLLGPGNQVPGFGSPGQGPGGPVPVPVPLPPVPQPVPAMQVPPQPIVTSNHEVMPPISQAQGPIPIVTNPSVPPPPMLGPPMMAGPIFPFMHHPPPPIMHPVPHGSYTSNQLPPPTFPKPPTQPPAMAIDINSLLINLTRSGLIGSKTKDKVEEKQTEEEEEEKEREADDRIPVELLIRSENLRKRRKWLIESVYRGMQCSSCGLRYPPEQTVQYSHHLDWHFRKNKKQQESTKKANTRKFYFSIEDWLQYEEIEDLEERVPSMFETEGTDEVIDPEDSEVPSVTVTSDTNLEVCPTCLDKFQQFFHQETEEWRYLNALQVDGLNYHPSCHQDNLRAEEAAKKEEEAAAKKEEEAAAKKEEEASAKKEEEAASKKEAEEAAEKEKAAEGEKMETELTEENKEREEESKMETDKKDEANEQNKEDAGEKGEVGSEMEADTQKLPEEEENTDVPMESQTSVTAKLDDMTLNSQLPVRIKEEPKDVEEDQDLLCYTPSLPVSITAIKQEVKKEPEEQDEEVLATKLPEEDDETSLLNLENENEGEWSNTAMGVNAAETDIASTIDGNTELSVPVTNTTTAPKIVFNVSKPAMLNNIESNNNNDANKNHIHNSNSIDEDDNNLTPPPFTVDYDLKPAFRDVELVNQPREARGIEMSGLCSIM